MVAKRCGLGTYPPETERYSRHEISENELSLAKIIAVNNVTSSEASRPEFLANDSPSVDIAGKGKSAWAL